jgi:hypothetical protein
MMEIVSFTLTPEIIADLDKRAVADDRSRSAIVRRILSDALADHAALQREAWRRFASLQCPPAAPPGERRAAGHAAARLGTAGPAAVPPAGPAVFSHDTGN